MRSGAGIQYGRRLRRRITEPTIQGKAAAPAPVTRVSTITDSRRRFLRYLAASPALFGPARTIAQVSTDLYAPRAVASAAEAVNVFDFHEVAKRVLRPAHYAYLAMGTDDGATLKANREGFRNYRLRVRRLINVRNVDTSIELFGRRCPVPILLAPCAAHGAYHDDAEPAAAAAASSRNVGMILSTVTSTSVREVNEAYGRPVWFQLYTSADWQTSLARAQRAEAAGCSTLVLTVDLPDSNREVMARFRRDTNPECQACHAPGVRELPPMIRDGGGIETAQLDWDYVDRLRSQTGMRLIIKGIVTADDARLAVEHGVDGVIVSNHGGRAEDSGLSTIEVLPEIVDAIEGRLPVICDSGFRRGTDIFKALAIGADAIAIGRPYLWGLAAFGQSGVEAVIDLLTRELEIVMRQAGTTSIAEIGRKHLA